MDESKLERDYEPEGVPNARNCPVDFRIEGKGGVPVFLYGVPNRDKARLTTAILILAWSDAADRSRPPLGTLASRRHVREARENADAGETPAFPGRCVHRHN